MKKERERIDSYTLRVVAEDSPFNASQTLSSERTVTIIVADTNDHAPVFVSPHASVVSVGARSGQKIAKIQAKDEDSGLNASIGYQLLSSGPEQIGSNMFGLDSDGTLYLKRAITYGSRPLYHVTVVATDRKDSRDRRRREGNQDLDQTTSTQYSIVVSSSATIGLKFARDTYEFDVSEDSAVGTEVGRVSAGEKSPGKVEYYMTRIRSRDSEDKGIYSVDAVFDVDRDSGIVRISRTLDRETLGGSVVLDVYAVDSAARQPHATSCKVSLFSKICM